MVLGALAAGVTASAAVAVGCGGDDNATPAGDGGSDGTTTDSAPPEDVVTPPMGDSSPPGKDSGPEAAADAAADAPTDAAPSDAQGDARGEAGDAETPLQLFPGQLAQAICSRFASCCFLGGDASTFNMSECLGSFGPFGYQGSSAGSNSTLLQNGHLAFDASAAASCISQINAIDCTANLRTSAQEIAIRSACFGAMTGTLDAGTPCGNAIECAPGLYCTPGDGGANSAVCAPMRGSGQSCGDFGADPNASSAPSETICSFRGSGNTGLTCHNEDYTTGDFFPDASTWQCQAQQAAAAGCNQNVDCTTALCDPGPNQDKFTCATSETFIYPFACATFLKDGG